MLRLSVRSDMVASRSEKEQRKCCALGGDSCGGVKPVYQSMLNELKANINVFGNAINVTRRWEKNRATSSKQNAKRSQRAGRLEANRAGDENNVGKPC